MSITEKLAQALLEARTMILTAEIVTPENDASYLRIESALAEYDATPAVEVTADAVVAQNAYCVFANLHPRLRDGYLHDYDIDIPAMQAALSAANARLAKDAERWHTLVELVHAEEWNGWDVHVPSNLRRETDGDLVAAVDAATAQAKQAEGE